MFTTIVGNVDDNTINIFCKYFGKQEKRPGVKLKEITENVLDTTINKSIRFDLESIVPDKEYHSTLIGVLKDENLSPQDKAYNWMFDCIIQNRLNQKEIWSRQFRHELIPSCKKNILHFSLVGLKNDANDEISEFYNVVNDILQNGFTPQDISYAQNLYVKDNIFDDEK